MNSQVKPADGSALGSQSKSGTRTSVYMQNGDHSGAGEKFRFFENFLYPFIAETNRTMKVSMIMNFVMGILFIAQLYFGMCFDFARKNVDPTVEIIEKILFLGLTSDLSSRTVSFAIITVINVMYILIFLYSYVSFRMTYDFSKLSRLLMKYILGNFTTFTIIINPMFLFASLSALGANVSGVTVTFTVISIMLNITSAFIIEYITIPIICSPYISFSDFFLWNVEYIIHALYVFSVGFGLNLFFTLYANWYQIIPPIVGFWASYILFKYGLSLHQKVHMYCELFTGWCFCYITSSTMAIVSVFTTIPNTIRYLVPLGVMIVAASVAAVFISKKRKKIVSLFSYDAILANNLTTEESKSDYFASLNIKDSNMAFTYLISGLENASPLFLDFSFTRYLINRFPEDNQLLILQAWFVSFFPNEQLVIHSLITLINKMIQPTHFQKVMRFQLHRVHVFRQSSASKEANVDLNRVKQLTDTVIAENCKFWANASLPRSEIKDDFHRKLSAIRQKGEAGWAEVIDKYPNNARFASEYSRFLIEGVCEFKEGIKWYNRAMKIDSGQHKETDQLFKTFVVSYPFYLKQGIVNFNGDIKIKKVMKDENSTVSTSTSSSKGLSLTDQSSNDDSDSTVIDLQESEKALPQAPLRLAFESAVKAMKPRVISNSTVSAIVRLIVSLSFCSVVFAILFPIFSDSQTTFKHLSEISKVQQLFSAVGDQTFWMLVSSIKAFDTAHISNYFGPNLRSTPSYTNLKASISTTVSNLTAMFNQRIDDLSHSLYLATLSASDDYQFVEFLTKLPYNQITCEDFGSGYEPVTSSDGIAIDGLLRSFLIQASKLSSMATSTTPPQSAKNLFESKNLCEFYTLYSMIQSSFNDFAQNRSVIYYQEITHYLNTTSPQSIYMGDPETNFAEGEFTDTTVTTNYADIITNVFIAFAPFIILVFSMPSVIFLSAVLSSETKVFTNILLSMPADTCKEASEKIQKGSISGGKASGYIASSNTGSSFPFYIINFINAILLIGIIIALALYTQSISKETNTFIMQYSLFMELRNLFMQIGFLTQNLVLSNVIENSPSSIPFQVKAPYISTQDFQALLPNLSTSSSMIQGIIDIGSDLYHSALGINSKIDAARFDPLCEQETDTMYSLDFYKCLSFDRVCAFFTARAKEINTGISSLNLESEDLYNFALLINSRLMIGFEKLLGTYEVVFSDTISTFHIFAIIIFIICIIFSFVSFFIEVGVLSAIKDMFRSFNIIMLRINPIHFVQNQAATAFLIGKENANESQITSAAHAVFQTSTDAMVLLNNDCIIEKLNPAATSIFHFTPEQMLGQHSAIIIPKDNQKNSQLYYTMQLMASGQCGLVYEAELEGIRDDGAKVPIKATMIGFSSNQRNAEIFAIMCKDQTEEMKQKEAVEIAKKQSDELLLKILPPDIIRRINRGEKDITMVVPSASVIFIDICQFSSYMATLSASQLMCNLNAVFTEYDKIVAGLPLITKIKLIGDDYMAAAGLFSPDEPPKMHAIQIITFGLRVLEAIEELNEQLNANLMVRIGVNSGGPIIAGVLGTEKPLFDIIGDAINVAARLQSTDIPGFVQISKATYELVAAESRFHIEERGEIFLKGKGNQTTYLVSNELDAFRLKDQKQPLE